MSTYHVSPFLLLVACAPPLYMSYFGICRRSAFLMSMPLLPQPPMASLAIPEQGGSCARRCPHTQACGVPSWHVCYGFGSAVCHSWAYTPVGSLAACLDGCDVVQGPAESYFEASGKILRAQKKDPPSRLSVPVFAGPRAFGPWPTARRPNRTISELPGLSMSARQPCSACGGNSLWRLRLWAKLLKLRS